MAKVKFITLTNDGYLDYTLNCIESLRTIDSGSDFMAKQSTGFNPECLKLTQLAESDLECYCIGTNSYNAVSKKTQAHRIDARCHELQSLGKGDWLDIMMHKLNIIYINLLDNDYVCFVDSDVVFKSKGFLQYCLDAIGDNDILVMNDGFNDIDPIVSAGFMFVKSNITTRYMLNPRHIKHPTYGWSIGKYLTKNMSSITIEFLPIDLFANGGIYYFSDGKMNPYLVHFNYVLASNKKLKMIEYESWLMR